MFLVGIQCNFAGETASSRYDHCNKVGNLCATVSPNLDLSQISQYADELVARRPRECRETGPTCSFSPT